MQRWTIKELNQLDDLSFAVAILIERKAALGNPQTPLYRKLDQAIARLNEMRDTEPPERPEEIVYTIVKDYCFQRVVVPVRVRRRGGGVIELEHEESPLVSTVYTFPEAEWGKSIFNKKRRPTPHLAVGAKRESGRAPILKIKDGGISMTFFDYEKWGKTHRITLKVATYLDGNLAIHMEAWDEGCAEPWSSLTVNLDGVSGKDCAFIDTNNNGVDIIIWIIRNGLAVPTGVRRRSGFCEYEEYRFRADRLRELDPEGYADYLARRKGC